MTPRLEAIHTTAALQRWRQGLGDAQVCLVPTMGALHAGHLALVQQGMAQAESVVVSIFVNPTQFGPGEDLDAYPRTLDSDLQQLSSVLRPSDVVFCPTVPEIYGSDHQTLIKPGVIASRLCGESRPGHFMGVCTVVYLLMRLTRCDWAVFGNKDYQQLQVIKKMAADLRLDVEIVGTPTVRDPDGLALSSRNRYLSPSERKVAVQLSKVLSEGRSRIQSGGSLQETAKWAFTTLDEMIDLELEYFEVVHPHTLEPADPQADKARAIVAAKVGQTRLIDNMGWGAS